MKFTAEFFGASHMNGEVYPRTYAIGEDCPDDLLDAAMAAEAVEDEAALAERLAAEAKAAEDAAKKAKA